MKLYITSGTEAFLKKVIEEHMDEELVLLQNIDQFILIHQTEGDCFFKEPRKYEVIASRGNFPETGFAYFHHIPVTDEGRPLFEYHYKTEVDHLAKETNLIAIRILKPFVSDTYVIVTIWKNEAAYKAWKPAQSLEEAHLKATKGKWLKKRTKLFPRPSFTIKYKIVHEDDE